MLPVSDLTGLQILLVKIISLIFKLKNLNLWKLFINCRMKSILNISKWTIKC